MNKLLFALLITSTMIFSCTKKEKKVNCPDKKYYMHIALANNTDYTINVVLYPKQAYLDENGYFKACDYSGQRGSKNLNLEPKTTPMWSFDHVIYETTNVDLSPSDLTRQIFDSICFEVENEWNTKVSLLPDTSINYLHNPFEMDTLWNYLLQNTSMPDMDCENKSDTKSYRFYIEEKFIHNNSSI